ncbi:MAG: response regulator transcription factor, partial [Planctomycetota bacterium]
IRRDIPGPRGAIPIIAMTAHALKGDRERCIAGGMSGYVSKPIDADMLDEEIARLLGGRPRPRAATVDTMMDGIYDHEAALSRLAGDEELLRELADLFGHQVDESIATLLAALEAGDTDTAQRTHERSCRTSGTTSGISSGPCPTGTTAAQIPPATWRRRHETLDRTHVHATRHAGEPDMRVLIAEDDPVSRRVLEATLQRWTYDVIVTEDGAAALEALQTDDPPHLLVLDWMMPGHDGPEICRQLRAREDGDLFYILLLTAKSQPEDIVAGLEAGADDYVTKPFDRDELRARVRTGERIIGLQDRLADRVSELETALATVKQLSGLLPMCAYCKRIREGDDYWQAVEKYLASHTEAVFSHGVCPDCFDKIVQPQIDEL